MPVRLAGGETPRPCGQTLERILRAEFEEGTSEVIGKAERQLDEFFAGQRREFDMPLLFVGTDFQKTVWNELLKIPVRADDFLRRDGTKNRHAQSRACGCQRQRSQFDVYFRAVPPRHR